MTHKELVIRTLEAYASSYESEDDIVNDLCSARIGPLLAERLNVLVPLAFGRVLIWHMEKDVDFSMTAILTAQDGSSKSYDLKTDTIFRCALEIGMTMFHEGPRHLFKGAASVSAEVRR